MKVEKAAIKLVLRTNKVLSNGCHPIMIRVNWQGKRAEKSTGYSCKKSEWNDKTNLLKEGRGAANNALQINIVLSEKLKKTESIRNNLIIKGEPYSADDIIEKLEEETTENKPSLELNEFFKHYYTRKNLRLETIGSVTTSINCFSKFINKKKIYLVDIAKVDVESFGRWMVNHGYKTNTIITTLRNLSGLFSFAEECGIINESPFKNSNISKKYRQENHTQPLNKESLVLFRQYYLEYVSTIGGDDKIFKNALKIHSKLFAMNVFLISYELQGLALVDLAHLTTNEVQELKFTQDGKGYLLVVTHRRKTGKEVKVVLTPDAFNLLLFKPYLDNMIKTGYLLPIFRGKDDTDKKKLHRMRYATLWVNRMLHGYGQIEQYKPYIGIWKEFNNWLLELIEKNEITLKSSGVVVTKDNVKSFLIDERTTFYAARHTFASNFINSEGATAGELATLLGRNVSDIDRYIRSLQTVQDIINARNKMK